MRERRSRISQALHAGYGPTLRTANSQMPVTVLPLGFRSREEQS